MGQPLDRPTRSRPLRGAWLAVLCVVAALVVPATAAAQATSGPGSTPASPPTAPAAPPAGNTTDAVTDTAPPADGAATPPADGAADPGGAATTEPGAADPNAPVDPGAAADPNALGADPGAAQAPPAAQNPADPAAGTGEAATTGGVVVDEPDDSLPGWVWGAVALGIVVAALVAWLLVLASGRFERLAPVGHALGEAGWRLSNRWAEFTDWLRFGSGR